VRSPNGSRRRSPAPATSPGLGPAGILLHRPHPTATGCSRPNVWPSSRCQCGGWRLPVGAAVAAPTRAGCLPSPGVRPLRVDGRSRRRPHRRRAARRRGLAVRETQRELRAALLMAGGDAARVVDVFRPEGPATSSISPVHAGWPRSGRSACLAEVLAARSHATVSDDLGPVETTVSRFDAYWQLGDATGPRGGRGSRRRPVGPRGAHLAAAIGVRRHRLDGRARLRTGAALADSQPRRSDIDWRIGLDFAFNHVDDILEPHRLTRVRRRLGPRGRYTLARRSTAGATSTPAGASWPRSWGRRTTGTPRSCTPACCSRRDTSAPHSTIGSPAAACGRRSTRSSTSPACTSASTATPSGCTWPTTTPTAFGQRSVRQPTSSPSTRPDRGS
jgi:hypothetical protein